MSIEFVDKVAERHGPAGLILLKKVGVPHLESRVEVKYGVKKAEEFRGEKAFEEYYEAIRNRQITLKDIFALTKPRTVEAGKGREAGTAKGRSPPDRTVVQDSEQARSRSRYLSSRPVAPRCGVDVKETPGDGPEASFTLRAQLPSWRAPSLRK